MKRKITSIILMLAMVLSLLPAPALADGTGAFGLSTPTHPATGSREYWDYMASAPFGALNQDNYETQTVTLNEKDELFMAYGWDAGKSGKSNWLRTWDASVDGIGDLSKFSNLDNSYRTAGGTSGINKYYALAADSTGFNPGSGKDEYVAYLHIGENNGLYLVLMDRNLKEIVNHRVVNTVNDYFQVGKRDAYEMGGFMSVAAGDFDNDGIDSVIIYNPGASITEYTYDGRSFDWSGRKILDLSGNTAVSMEAEDVDRDGFDELIITTGGGKDSARSYLYIYDKMPDGTWNRTYGENQVGMVVPTSSVGNLATSINCDMPEIITAGFNGNSDDSFRWSVVHASDDSETAKTQSNGQCIATYTVLGSGTGSTNGFTKRGFWTNDGNHHPLQVQCFNYQGGADADGIFISGTVYSFNAIANNNKGDLKEVYTYNYFNSGDKGVGSYIITNEEVEDVAAGNFDGNDEGREQVIFTTLLKQEAKSNSFARTYVYNYNGSSWTGTESGGWMIDHHDRAYTTLTAFDNDNDSIIARFESMEMRDGKPDVLAVLGADPYFEELGEDYRGMSETLYSTSEGSGKSHAGSHTLSGKIFLGYEFEIPIPGAKTGQSIEAELGGGLTWGNMNETSKTFILGYHNDTGENAVVVYQIPTLLFTYTDVNTGDRLYVEKMLDPSFSIVSLDSYNEQAEFYGMTVIDESKLGTPGDPFSYPASADDAIGIDGSGVQAAKNWVSYQTAGYIDQEFEYDKTHEETFAYDVSVDVSEKTTIAGFSVGLGAGYEYSGDDAKINTSGMTKSGTVSGLGGKGGKGLKDFKNYMFQWRFAHWTMEIEDGTETTKRIPVLGYLVQDQDAPPSPGANLKATGITSSGFTLTWEAGRRPASEYRVYRLNNDGTYTHLDTVEGSDTKQDFSYDVEGMKPGNTYKFYVRGYDGKRESVDSEPCPITTNPDDGEHIQIGTVEDQTAAAGESATFSADVTKGDAKSYTQQWYVLTPGAARWTQVSGGTDSQLTLEDVTLDMDGNQYRLEVKAVVGLDTYNYSSNAARLTVEKADTDVDLTIDGATDGEGTEEQPYTGQGDSSYVETETSTEEETASGTWTHDGHEDDVFMADGEYIAVCDDDGTVTGYQLELNDAEQGFHSPSEVALEERYVRQEGTDTAEHLDDAAIPDGFTTTPVTETTADGETYYQLAYWTQEASSNPTNEDTAPDAAPAPEASQGEATAAEASQGGAYSQLANPAQGASANTFWLRKSDLDSRSDSDAGYTFYRKNGDTFERDDTFTLPAGALISQVYTGSLDGQLLILENEDGYFALNNAPDGWKLNEVFRNISSRKVLNIGGKEIPLEALNTLYSYTKTKEVAQRRRTHVQGDEITLSATLKNENTGAYVPSGTPASFVITNESTGATSIIPATVGENGTVTAKWTAPSESLYSIRATMASTDALAAAASDTIYYDASGKGAVPGSVNPFTDVDKNDYFYDAVLWAVDNGITYGTDAKHFSPATNCTRAQFVTFLWRAAGSPEPGSSTNRFNDVSETRHSSYYKAILWAVEEGITAGTSGTTFSPDTAVTRAQSVTLMHRYAQKAGIATETGVANFDDVSNEGALTAYYEAIGWAVANGITYGTGNGKFSPMEDCNRGMMITFLHRLFTDATA